MPIDRGLVALFALLVCAWFVLGARQAHDINAATSILGQPGRLTAADAAHARSLLDAASALNPDRQVDILRAQVALDLGNRQRAEQILRPVVRDEPKDAEAWYWVVQAAPNPATFRLGLARLAQLVPPFPPPH